jgi:acrylyl-CoA reductase (NADPH)
MLGDSGRFKAFRITESVLKGKAEYIGEVLERSISDLPTGEVLIRVDYSALNYKDALSASGNRGVTKLYPHTPGIDAAGEVVTSSSSKFQPGDSVLVTGFDLGMNTDGGFAEFVRVPADWVVSIPVGLTARSAMILGTAGITAGLCVEKLILNGLSPEQGEVLVTGATGGVGAVAIALLAKLGFTVVACTGKPKQETFLRSIGAASVIDRQTLSEPSSRALQKERWSGAVDVAGGQLLRNILSSLRYGGSVACCGLVDSPAFEASVFPFILRGVNLLGVDSVNLPTEQKVRIWRKFATEWNLSSLEHMTREIGMQELPEALKDLQMGRSVGRVLLNVSDTA